jgi:hypothetical protein
VDDRRGHGGDPRGTRRGLRGARRVRPGLGHRGVRQRGHRLALHRLAGVLEAAESRAQKLVALQFFVLAPYVAVESLRALAAGERPDATLVGIALAAASVVVMPVLGIAKQRLADRLGSAATKGEGRQNMLCAYLAAALLVGLVANAVAGAWWLDPAVGLLIAFVAVKEGREAWRGEGCGCVAAPAGAAPDAACRDACCDGP